MCRNLTKLHWKRNRTHYSLDTLAQMLEQRWWPHLEDLYLGGLVVFDKQLATLVSRLPPLKNFGLASGQFGPLCFAHLRQRLFDSLRLLDLQSCTMFTSRMALEDLLNCSHLESLKTSVILMSDLRLSPQLWTCQGLQHLRVIFTNDTGVMDANTLIFDQLSTLRRLETLNLNLRGTWLAESELRAEELAALPWWRLDAGLGRLAGLKRLRSLKFVRTNQELRRENVEWMLAHRPRLEEIAGRMSSDPETEKELGALFEQHGVSR